MLLPMCQDYAFESSCQVMSKSEQSQDTSSFKGRRILKVDMKLTFVFCGMKVQEKLERTLLTVS